MNNNLLKSFARYVSLNILGMIGLSCYILADTFFIARGIGPDGMTALNIAIPAYTIISGIGLMLGIGGATRFSLLKSKSAFTQSVYAALSAAAVFLLIGIICPDKIAVLLGADDSVLAYTTSYLRVILCFAPMFIMNSVVMSFVRNDGNPGLSMAAMLAGSFSNVLLDWVLIFPCGLGMFGAALATGIAPVISLAILSSHFVKRKNSFGIIHIKPAPKEWFEIASLGIAPLITEISGGVVILVFNFIILGLEGNTGVAAYSVIANVSIVVTSIFGGISQGIQPVISKLKAEKDDSGVLSVRRYGFLTAEAAAIIIYAAILIFTSQIVGVFNRDHDAVLEVIAERGAVLYFSAFIFSGLNIVFSSYFGAVGNARDSFIISVLRGLVVIIPMALLLSWLFGMDGVWLSLAATEAIVLAVAIVIDKKEKRRARLDTETTVK